MEHHQHVDGGFTSIGFAETVQLQYTLPAGGGELTWSTPSRWGQQVMVVASPTWKLAAGNSKLKLVAGQSPCMPHTFSNIWVR